MKKFLFAFAIVSSLYAQPSPELMGLRVYANNDEYQLPILARGSSLTIEFDVAGTLAPNLQVIFKHASQEWIVDDNQFVNEPIFDRSQILTYTDSPNGVRHYNFSYKNSFPNSRDVVQFKYSGNYLFFIVEHSVENKILSEGRFILVDNIVPCALTITNTYYS